jgi:hypothetical protein
LNLGYFVLDNTLNNNTTLVELAKILEFDLKERRLRCIGHILNLITKRYLFRQDLSVFKEEYKKAGPLERWALWRRRREVEKLYNLVIYAMALGKRITLFKSL